MRHGLLRVFRLQDEEATVAVIDHIRKTSEAIILLLVVLSPWTFGSVHPFFRYCLTAGIAILILLWAVELAVQPRAIWSRYQWPMLVFLLVVLIQVLPLGPMADWLSPQSASLRGELLPTELEWLADETPARPVQLAARGRVSMYPAETLRRLYWFTLLALLFVRVQDLASTLTLRRLCYACLLNGSALAYFSVIQHFTAPDDGVVFWTYQSRGAAFGPFINRNHFAFYLNICFGLSLGLLGSRQMGKFSKLSVQNVVDSLKDSFSLWMVSVLIFMLGAVILCSSRGGLISLLGATVITAVFVASTGTFRSGWKWFLLAALMFGMASAMQMWLGFDFVESRYALYADNRTAVWLPLLRLIPQFPILGSGLGTLPHVEPLTRQTGAARDYYLEYAHNEYLQLVVETGILGLLCGLVLLWLLAAKISRRVRGSRHNAWLYVGLLFSLSAMALHSCAEFGLAIPAIAFLAVVVAGHIAGMGRVPEPLPSDHPGRWLVRGVAVCMVIVALLAVRSAKRTDLAERYFVAAQRAHKAGRVDQQVAHYEAALRYEPTNVEFLLDSSRLILEPESAVGKDGALLLRAQNDLVSARELCPLSSDAHFQIGRNIDKFTRADDKLTYYERARRARPADATLAYLTGDEYLAVGDIERAHQAFRDSLRLAATHLRDILAGLDHEAVSLAQVLPDDAEVLALAADWYADEEQEGIAEQLRRRALDLPELAKPQRGDLHYLKGSLAEQLGENEQAIRSYRSALLYSPENLNWQYQLSVLLVETNQFEAAHARIRQMLQQKPGHRAVLQLREEAIRRQGEQ